jgi:hypothetical protein
MEGTEDNGNEIGTVGRRQARLQCQGRIGIAAREHRGSGNRHRSRNRQHPSGLNENTGEFRVGENIIFGMSNGNIKIRRSPQGDEVEVAETTLAGLMIDAFFTDKFDGEYDVVSTR